MNFQTSSASSRGSLPRTAERTRSPRVFFRADSPHDRLPLRRQGGVAPQSMQQIAQDLLLSATDLVAFLECEHLSALDLRVATGTEVIEQTRTDSTELVARKGGEHGRAYLESLIAAPLEVVTIPSSLDGATSEAEAIAQTQQMSERAPKSHGEAALVARAGATIGRQRSQMRGHRLCLVLHLRRRNKLAAR